MPNILISSTIEEEETKDLLNKSLPNYRQAYSDRTSWLMACISELSYVKFNPIFKDESQRSLVVNALKLVNNNNATKALFSLIDNLAYDPEENKKVLEENVDFLKLKIIDTFDNNGTQAILLEDDNYIFLGFRGTEPTSMKDIKSDINAITIPCESGGQIHTGFSEAFNQVFVDIQKTLDNGKYKEKPLFITGHSLGGALATIAAKKLIHKGGIAACYTFGSPRVGNIEWISNIKTPMYRVVNAMDPVTMVPPNSTTIGILIKLFKYFPYVGGYISKLLHSKFNGYIHTGDMRYLTPCEKENYKEVILLPAVTFLFRLCFWFKRKKSLKKIPADHSISIYRKKLKVIASNRNNNTPEKHITNHST